MSRARERLAHFTDALTEAHAERDQYRSQLTALREQNGSLRACFAWRDGAEALVRASVGLDFKGGAEYAKSRSAASARRVQRSTFPRRRDDPLVARRRG